MREERQVFQVYYQNGKSGIKRLRRYLQGAEMKKSDQLTCHLLNSRFQKKSFTDFKEISDVIGDKRIKIHQLELEAIIKLLSRFGKELIFDKKINTLEGVNYLSLWLRQDNLKKI